MEFCQSEKVGTLNTIGTEHLFTVQTMHLEFSSKIAIAESETLKSQCEQTLKPFLQ